MPHGDLRKKGYKHASWYGRHLQLLRDGKLVEAYADIWEHAINHAEEHYENLLATEHVTLRKYKDTHANMKEWIHSHQKLEKELNELKKNLPTDEEIKHLNDFLNKIIEYKKEWNEEDETDHQKAMNTIEKMEP